MEASILLLIALVTVVSYMGKSYKISMITFAFIFINGLVSLIGYLFPQMPLDKIIHVQLWLNAVLLFAFVLSDEVASFLKTL